MKLLTNRKAFTKQLDEQILNTGVGILRTFVYKGRRKLVSKIELDLNTFKFGSSDAKNIDRFELLAVAIKNNIMLLDENEFKFYNQSYKR